MSTYDQPRSTFDMGRVMQRTFEVLGQNLGPFIGLALVCIALPQAAIAGATMFMLQNAVSQEGGGFANVFGPMAGLGFVGWLVTMVGTYVLEAGVLYAAVSQLNGKRVDLGQMVSTGFSYVLPLLGLGILMGLALVVGFILLIVPGIIMSVAWIVAAPSIVMERKGVTEAFGRSADLTRDNRWAIFALCLIFMVVYFAATWVVAMLSGGVTAAAGATDMMSVAGIINIVVTPLLTAALSLVGTTGVAAIYFELRSIKEGVGAKDLAAVFD